MAKPPESSVTINGTALVPDTGCLVIPNRLEFRDLLILEDALKDRELVFLAEPGAQFDALLRSHLDKGDVNTLEVYCDDAQMEAFKKLIHHEIAAGRIVVFVPSKSITRSGQLTTVPSSILGFLCSCGATVQPLVIDHPAETQLSIDADSDPDEVVMTFARPLEREASNLANYLEALHLASEETFSSRRALEGNLAHDLLCGLKLHASTCRVVDGNDGSELRYDKLLGAAAALSRRLRDATDRRRIGIILPPGKGGMVANLAVLFAGKVPVNLNFTAGEKAVNSCVEQAELDLFITAHAFVEKVPTFPWPDEEKRLHLEDVLPPLKKRILYWYLLAKMFPAKSLAKMLKIPERGGDEEAVLLFTSGSSGDPKGVVLSHRNLIANVNQFGARLSLGPTDAVLGCLPLFHSFGSTVTIFYPVIEGVNLVTYPSPLEPAKLAALIDLYSISLLVSTPTFLRGYLRKADPEQLSTLKLVVTGAEKLPAKVAEAFEKRFGKPVLEGYGLTETSPVSNVNLPDPEPEHANDRRVVIPSRRPGSVGQLIPGIAVRITDPDTDEPLPLTSTGMIWLRGPNIFSGYLKQPEKTKEVIVNGWFRTGDIGRVDEDGFLYIEGRLSRFSKIGGEMVPHETVEAAISQALDLDSEGTRSVAIVGIPDEAKGEALVLLCSLPDLDLAALRSKLLESGIPALWVPKKVATLDEIPVLASGKLDIRGCEQIAREG